jgi:serine/threonine-protein phosphatase 2A regulatory subunit B''
VMSLLEEAKLVNSSTAQTSPSVSASLLPGVFKEGCTPPLSPRNSPLSPKSPMRRSGSGPSNLGSPLRKSSDPLQEVIPQVSNRLAL